MIGRTQFNHQQGLFYPDGTVRRIAEVEAVMGSPADFLTEKPDSKGLPFRRSSPERLVEYLQFVTRNPVSEATWRERNTLIEASAAFAGVYRGKKDKVKSRLASARKAYDEGKKHEAFATVGELLLEARRELIESGRAAKPEPVPE
jgi:hypothetical protein